MAMTVDLVSPRISFSHDLKDSDSIPIEYHHHQRSDALLLESSIDFEFGIGRSFQSELSPADVLFANGKILPIEVKKINSLPIQQRPTRENLESKPISPSLRKNPIIRPPPPPSTAAGISRTEKQSLKELLSINSDDLEEEEEEKKQNSKPFWQFRRSSSLNFDRTNSLIRSLHFLSRSNSTGSAPNPNPKPSKIIIQKDPNSNPKPSSSIKRTNSSSSSSSSSHNNYYLYKSPSLKKNYSNGGHGGVRISPVLHIPHACISRNSVLFGFSSLFCNGKSKKKKKSC